jgi:hypothetical protein
MNPRTGRNTAALHMCCVNQMPRCCQIWTAATCAGSEGTYLSWQFPFINVATTSQPAFRRWLCCRSRVSRAGMHSRPCSIPCRISSACGHESWVNLQIRSTILQVCTATPDAYMILGMISLRCVAIQVLALPVPFTFVTHLTNPTQPDSNRYSLL